MEEEKLNKISKLLEQEVALKNNSTKQVDLYDMTNNIIQFKIQLGFLKYKDEIFVHIKELIILNIGVIKEKCFEYDHINIENIFKYISLFEGKEKISLAKYLERSLRLNGLDEYSHVSQKIRKKSEIAYLYKQVLSRSNLSTNIFRLILCATSYNIFAMITAFVSVAAIKSIILLPAPYERMGFYYIKYDQYFDGYLSNHISNILGSLSGINKIYSVVPLNFLALLLMLIGKLIVFILIANIIIKELEKRIS